MNDISIIGINIKKLRERRNMSARELAQRSGVGASTISEIESGKRQSLNSATTQKIIKALNVSIEELFKAEAEFEYYVEDLEQTLSLIFESDELTLDDKPLSDMEKYLLKVMFSANVEVIRKNREQNKLNKK